MTNLEKLFLTTVCFGTVFAVYQYASYVVIMSGMDATLKGLGL